MSVSRLTVPKAARRLGAGSDDSATESSLSELSSDDQDRRLRRFLELRGLGRFADRFEQEELDMDGFLTLTADDLAEFGKEPLSLSSSVAL